MERAFRTLGSRAPLAMMRVLTRASGAAKTFMVREVSRDLGLKVATVRDQVRVEAPTRERLFASVSVSGRRLPLIDFRATGPEPSRGKGRGVRARMPGGAGRYPHAFIATMASGHRGVFQRVARRRLPIRQLYGPSLPHVFEKYLPAGHDRAQESMLTTLESELKFRISEAASA